MDLPIYTFLWTIVRARAPLLPTPVPLSPSHALARIAPRRERRPCCPDRRARRASCCCRRYILPGACYFILFPNRPTRFVGGIILAMGCCIMPLSLYLIFFK